MANLFTDTQFLFQFVDLDFVVFELRFCHTGLFFPNLCLGLGLVPPLNLTDRRDRQGPVWVQVVVRFGFRPTCSCLAFLLLCPYPRRCTPNMPPVIPSSHPRLAPLPFPHPHPHHPQPVHTCPPPPPPFPSSACGCCDPSSACPLPYCCLPTPTHSHLICLGRLDYCLIYLPLTLCFACM